MIHMLAFGAGPKVASVLILIFDIIAIIDVIKGNMDAGRKALWILLILILPLVGLLLYFVFAKKAVG